MRILYLPFSIIAKLISARIGRSVFRSVWAKFDHEPPPKAGDGRDGIGKTVSGRALEAAVMAGSAAAVDQLFAKLFHHLIGIWPKKPPKPDKA